MTYFYSIACQLIIIYFSDCHWLIWFAAFILLAFAAVFVLHFLAPNTLSSLEMQSALFV